MPWPLELESYVNSGERGAPLRSWCLLGSLESERGQTGPGVIHGHSQTVFRSTSHPSEGGWWWEGGTGAATQPGPVCGLVVKETSEACFRLELEPGCGPWH